MIRKVIRPFNQPLCPVDGGGVILNKTPPTRLPSFLSFSVRGQAFSSNFHSSVDILSLYFPPKRAT